MSDLSANKLGNLYPEPFGRQAKLTVGGGLRACPSVEGFTLSLQSSSVEIAWIAERTLGG
jgi:hypothetical protein